MTDKVFIPMDTRAIMPGVAQRAQETAAQVGDTLTAGLATLGLVAALSVALWAAVTVWRGGL